MPSRLATLIFCFAAAVLHTGCGDSGSAPAETPLSQIKLRDAATPNALAGEMSPHLQDFARQAVDWMPWGDAAFAKAKAEDKPVLVSVGYDGCRWTARMARETFSQPDVARMLNRDFICVKVDRAERPDIDLFCMLYAQSSGQAGGWPLNVWMTPDRIPFAANGYAPPVTSDEAPSLASVAAHLSTQWDRFQKGDGYITAQSERSLAELRRNLRRWQREGEDQGPFSRGDINRAYELVASSYDPEFGGFGAAPKFPRGATLAFLIDFAESEPAGSYRREKAAEMVAHTLHRMADGAIRDHLAGGFHRYSADVEWALPQFEKMLVDQAEMALALVAAHRLTGEPRFADFARETLDYAEARLAVEGGGYAAGESYDPELPDAAAQPEPGAFYTWEAAEIDAALSGQDADAEIFRFACGIRERGNVPPTSDPHREFLGSNTLHRARDDAEAAAKFGIDEAAIRAALNRAREKLASARAKRPQPSIDGLAAASWNGRMVSALCAAARQLGDERFGERARRAGQFLAESLYQGEGELRRGAVGGEALAALGISDDYAATARAFLDLHDLTGEAEWLRLAAEIHDAHVARFFDAEAGGFRLTQAPESEIPLELKPVEDLAETSGNSLGLANLLWFAAHREGGGAEDKARAEKQIAFFLNQVRSAPESCPAFITAARPLAGDQ